MGIVRLATRGLPGPRRLPCPRNCRVRPARHHIRSLRRLGADRGLAVVLLGRHADCPPREHLRARGPHKSPARAKRQVSWGVPERRATGADELGGDELRHEPAQRRGGLRAGFLRARSGIAAAAAGQLPLARDLGQHVRGGLRGKPAARGRVRGGAGQLAHGAADACAERVWAVLRGALGVQPEQRDYRRLLPVRRGAGEAVLAKLPIHDGNARDGGHGDRGPRQRGDRGDAADARGESAGDYCGRPGGEYLGCASDVVSVQRGAELCI